MVAVAVLQINTNKKQYPLAVQQEMLFPIQELLSLFLLALLVVAVVRELMEHQTLATLEQVKLLLHQQTVYLELYPLAVAVVAVQVALQVVLIMVVLAVQVEQLTVVKVAIAAVIMGELVQELLVVQQMELVVAVVAVVVATHILTLLLLVLLDSVVKLQCILSK
jgi:hypothetical protein